MASLSDVAKVAGVSLTTASLVLNRPKQPNRVSEACAQRVREAAKKLGYIPNYHARSMKLGRAETIAVAMDVGTGQGADTVSELTDAYFNHLIGGIELHLRNVGFQMTLIGPARHTRAPERGLEGVGQRRFDGMIVLGAVIDPSKPNLLADCSGDLPIVAIQYSGQTQVPVVDYNEEHAVGMAVNHFAELGHKRLLWLGRSDQKPVLPGGRREEIFHRAAAAKGLSTSSCRFEVPNPVGVTSRTALVEQAHICLRDHLRREGRNFTGVLAYNDPMGIGVCSALAAAEVRIPEEVSVMAFDDIEAALCIPRLSSVSHKLYEMGKRAAERVLEIIDSPAARERLRGKRELLEPELVIRQSMGRAAG